jgi:MFS transporter, PAT family, beta-lactamase induction signal transducer AmpG
MAVVLLTGFSSGLPLALTGTALQAWLTREGIDRSRIGLFSAFTLPYTLKFLWSPLMDRFVPPFLGRRRGWMVICQLLLIAGISAMALTGLSAGPWGLAGLALAVAFFSASQDIAIDAYRTEILRPEELGVGASVNIMGYRAGMICSGAFTLILSDHMSWGSVYLLMAAAMSVGVVTTILAPEPALPPRPPRTLAEAVVRPFAEFLLRRGAWEILLFILIYKVDAALVQAMMTPFLLGAGFSGTEVGAVSQGLGIFATIAGAVVGGAAMTRLGALRSLWTFGLLQCLAGLSFTALALLTHKDPTGAAHPTGAAYSMMVVAIVVENVCSGMATSAFTGFLMGLCDRRFTATQYALLSSLMALGRIGTGTGAGWFSNQVSWPAYFAVSTLAGIPGLLLLLRYRKWQQVSEQESS